VNERNTELDPGSKQERSDLFVRRPNELKRISEFVASEASTNILYVCGESGSGKSRLAWEASKNALRDPEKPTCVALAEVDPEWRPEDLLVSLYCGLSASRRFGKLPALKRFAFAYAKLMERRWPSIDTKLRHNSPLSKASSQSDIIADASDVGTHIATINAAGGELAIDAIGEVGAAGKLLKKGFEYFSDRKLRKSHTELDELDELPLRDLSEKLEDFFCEDLSQWLRGHNDRRVLFIIDDLDTIQYRSQQSSKRMLKLVRKVFDRCRGAKFVVFGKADSEWLFPNEWSGRKRLDTHSIDDLTPTEAGELVSLHGLPIGKLRERILSGPLFLEAIIAKCAWVRNYASKFGGPPDAAELPDLLEEVYDKLLSFRTDDEQILLRALSHADAFDERMMRALAHRMNLPIEQHVYERIMHSASVVQRSDGWMRLRGLLLDHLRYPPTLQPKIQADERTQFTKQVIHHHLEGRTSDPENSQFRSAIVALQLVPNLGQDWHEPIRHELLTRALNHTCDLVETKEELPSTSITQVLEFIIELVTEENSQLKEALAASPTSTQLLLAFGRFTDLASSSVLYSSESFEPSTALKLTEHLKLIVGSAMGSALGVRKRDLSQEALSLEVHSLLLRRTLAPDFEKEGFPPRIATSTEFAEQLAPAVEALAHVLGEQQIARPGYALTAAIAFGRLSRLHGVGEQDAASHYKNASQFLQMSTDLMGDSRRLLLEAARHSLHPIDNVPIQRQELTSAVENLRKLIKSGDTSPWVFQLWIRAQIRVAQKYKDGELGDVDGWWDPLEKAELTLIQLDEQQGDVERAGRVRLFLRLLRKRNELGAPASPHLNKFYAMLDELAENLPTTRAYFYTSILREMTGAVNSGWVDGRDFKAVLAGQVRDEQLSDWRAILAMNFLLETLDRVGPEMIQRTELLSKISKWPGLEHDRLGMALKTRAEQELSAKIYKDLLVSADATSVENALRLSEAYLQNATLSEEVAAFGAERLELCRRLLARDNRKEHIALIKGLERQFLLYAANNLRLYAKALEIKLQYCGSHIGKRERLNNEATLSNLKPFLEADAEIGSLLYSGIDLSRGTRWRQGGQLLFEALALTEHRETVPQALRRTVRSEFAKSLWSRMVRMNNRNKSVGSAPPEAVLEAFVAADTLTADVFLSFLKAQPIPDFRPGLIGVGKLQDATSEENPEASRFELDKRSVFIKHALLSIQAYHKYFPSSQEINGAYLPGTQEENAEPSASDDNVILNLVNPHGGKFYGSCRGAIFVSKILELFVPGLTKPPRHSKRDNNAPATVLMGASNSWCTVRVASRPMSSALAGNASMLRIVQNLLGVRRMTLVPRDETNKELGIANELKHFINNSWEDLRIQHISPSLVVLDTGKCNIDLDPRKLRTFRSKFEKMYPDRTLELTDPSVRFNWPGIQESEDDLTTLEF